MKEYTLNNKHPRVFKLIQKYNEINYEKKNQLIQEKCKIDIKKPFTCLKIWIIGFQNMI